MCGPKAQGCVSGDIRLDLAIDAAADIGQGSPTTFQASATMDLTALQFSFSTQVAGVSFGPSELNITEATLTLSNASASGACLPAGSSAGNPMDAPGLSLGVSAQGSSFGKDLQFGGDINSDGYCLWAAMGTLQQGMMNGANVELAYTSYANGAVLTLPATAGQLGKAAMMVGAPNSVAPHADAITMNVPAGNVALQGGFIVDSHVDTLLKGNGSSNDVTFTASASPDLNSFTADIVYSLGQGVDLLGTDGSGASLDLTSAELTVTYTQSPLSGTMAVQGNGNVVIPSGGSVASSSTPVFVNLGLTLSADSVDVSLTAGVNTAGGVVDDAFGQTGLDISDLAIQASYDITTGPAIGFKATAILPDSWTDNIKLVGDPTVSLAFELSETNPCIQFSIGDQSQTTPAVDVGGAGAVTASFVKLVIAPTGCSVPTSKGDQTILPGFALAFDGQILQASVSVALAISFPTATSVAVDAELDIAALSLPAATIDATHISLHFNTNTLSYALSFSGGLQIGNGDDLGGSVTVAGAVTFDIPNEKLLLDIQGTADLEFLILDVHADAHVQLDIEHGSLISASANATLNWKLLGLTLTGYVNMVYAQSELQDLDIVLSADLNFWVGDVGGSVEVHYCVGTLPQGFQQACQTNSAGGSDDDIFRVLFDGHFSLFGWQKHFYDEIVDKQKTDPQLQAQILANQPPATLPDSYNTQLILDDPAISVQHHRQHKAVQGSCARRARPLARADDGHRVES